MMFEETTTARNQRAMFRQMMGLYAVGYTNLEWLEKVREWNATPEAREFTRVRAAIDSGADGMEDQLFPAETAMRELVYRDMRDRTLEVEAQAVKEALEAKRRYDEAVAAQSGDEDEDEEYDLSDDDDDDDDDDTIKQAPAEAGREES